MTVYEYDDDGRLSVSVTVREAEYSAADVVALLESRHRERTPLGSHGEPLEDAMSPEADPGNGSGGYFYRARGPRRDHAAAELARAREIYFKQNPSAKGDPSLMWSVERVER